MSEVTGAQFDNDTTSHLVKTGVGKVYGIIVNSHTNGTLRLGDGITTNDETADKATATLTSDATNVADNETVTIGSTVYRFKDTPAQAYDVQIGANAAESLDNLKAAINASGTEGVEYFAGTLIHPTVTATTNSDTTQVVEAKTAGVAGNSIAVAETSTHLTWGVGVTTLSGGAAATITIMNTYTFPAGSSVLSFPEPINFVTGLYATVGGTLDYTVLFN